MHKSFKFAATLGLCGFLVAVSGAEAAKKNKKQTSEPLTGPVVEGIELLTSPSENEAYCESSCCWASGEDVVCSESGCFASSGDETAEYICPAS